MLVLFKVDFHLFVLIESLSIIDCMCSTLGSLGFAFDHGFPNLAYLTLISSEIYNCLQSETTVFNLDSGLFDIFA